ncbi:MAG: thioredoxin family protein [Alphaproteobacteria bacterium]|nr:thioredoxin family protein [Alphaproteobacteria bacterium]
MKHEMHAEKAAEKTMAPSAVVVGEPAPEFMLNDINDEHVMLSALKGKVVVLEWTNSGCPYVRKHYDSKNMQSLQEEATKDGVVWVSINSGAEGKEGFVTAEEAKTLMEKEGSHATHMLLDTNGAIGKLYGAKTTPHMFVIDKEGVLVYAGAIDSDNSFKPEAIKDATNYVREALNALKEGKPVEVSETAPYGCGVKY